MQRVLLKHLWFSTRTQELYTVPDGDVGLQTGEDGAYNVVCEATSFALDYFLRSMCRQEL